MQSVPLNGNVSISVPNKDALIIPCGSEEARTRCQQPMSYTGSLDSYPHKDLTPVIGREYTNLQAVDILNSPNRAQLISDLAVTVSERGVVFLRNQDITADQMLELTEILTEKAGCPPSSHMNVHPLSNDYSELGNSVGVISSEMQKRGGGITRQRDDYSRFASVGWHSDVSFERVPSDYSMLKIHTLPATGGDTLWASGCEIYDRLSPAMQAFLEGLTATHDANFFHEDAARIGIPIREQMRGSPVNCGTDLRAEHPVIRTNPVTGWKSIFVNKGFTRRINGVTKDESDMLLNYLFDMVTQNHDVQVRFKWNKNDLAIWDNRSNLHCATYDYPEVRTGDRVCSLGEAPYLDPLSKGRKVAMKERAQG